MATSGKGNSSARTAATAGSSLSKKKRKKLAKQIAEANLDPAMVLALCTRPLIELFATVNDVFEEDDAFEPARMQAGFGRIYRTWKTTREQIDEGFDERRGRSQPNQAGTGRRSRAQASVFRPD